jgi:hypothetical protein
MPGVFKKHVQVPSRLTASVHPHRDASSLKVDRLTTVDSGGRSGRADGSIRADSGGLCDGDQEEERRDARPGVVAGLRTTDLPGSLAEVGIARRSRFVERSVISMDQIQMDIEPRPGYRSATSVARARRMTAAVAPVIDGSSFRGALRGSCRDAGRCCKNDGWGPMARLRVQAKQDCKLGMTCASI